MKISKLMKSRVHFVSLLFIPLFFSSCLPADSNAESQAFMISPEILQKVSAKRIYFAHQSVGYNIMDGVSALTEGEVNIQESDNALDSDLPVFLHSEIGTNTQPLGKIADFSRYISQALNGKTDIAFLKFCYVDFDAGTDIKGVFDEYTDTIRNLESRYPHIRFIHFTAPLTISQKGIKNSVKRLLGRPVEGVAENKARQEYNELIRNQYDSVFDLASIESTRENGSRSVYRDKTGIYYSLLPEYTNDGGHLNEKGSRLVAQKLLQYISELE